MFATTTWVCRFGSPVRVSQWSNSAATIPRVGTWAIELCPIRVNSARSSRNASASRTAARCAATTRAWTSGSANAHSTLADFGAVNVRSNPATAARGLRAASSRVIASTAAARAESVIDSGSAATESAIRCAWLRNAK